MNKEQLIEEMGKCKFSSGWILEPHRAHQMARFWHQVKNKQKRYTGEDYFEAHLIPVAHLCSNHSEDAIKIAYLHDILEDTACTEELLREFFPKDIVDDVVLLTHIRNQPRELYYDKIKTSPRALLVKMADIAHNVSTLPNLDDEKLKNRLAKKYAHAIQYLMTTKEE